MGLGNWSLLINQDQIVRLPEDSDILELLFQFCYPERHPDLNDLEFAVLAKLAVAFEKYNVFSAIPICKIRMRYRHFDSRFSMLNFVL